MKLFFFLALDDWCEEGLEDLRRSRKVESTDKSLGELFAGDLVDGDIECGIYFNDGERFLLMVANAEALPPIGADLSHSWDGPVCLTDSSDTYRVSAIEARLLGIGSGMVVKYVVFLD